MIDSQVMEAGTPPAARLQSWVATNAMTLLRSAIGIVFVWFGALKLLPGQSPAEIIAGKTILTLTLGLVKPALSVPCLGVFEVLLGLSFLSGRYLKTSTLLLLGHMAGTLTPLLLFPAETFRIFPLEPNMLGQYILKNIILIAAALVIGVAQKSNE